MRKSIILAAIVMAAAVALPAAAQPEGGVLVESAPGVARAAATSKSREPSPVSMPRPASSR